MKTKIVTTLVLSLILLVGCNNTNEKVNYENISQDTVDLLGYKAVSFIMAYTKNIEGYIEKESQYLGEIENFKQFTKSEILDNDNIYLDETNFKGDLYDISFDYQWSNENSVVIAIYFSTSNLEHIQRYEAEYTQDEGQWKLIFIGIHQ